MEHNIPNAVQDEIESESGWNPEDEATKNSSCAPKSGHHCKRCDRAFKTTEAYRIHLKTSKLHHVCQYCNHDWHSVRSLRLHWQKSHGSVYCEYCDQHFSSPEQKRKHSDAKHCFCERCNEWFLSEGHRGFHWASSDAHKSTYCKLCKVDFESSGAYETHSFATHTPMYQKKSPGHDQNAKENSKSEKSKKYESGGRGKFEKDSKSQEQDQNRKSKSRKNESNFREDFSEEKKAGSSKDRSHTANMPASEAPPNHYATLRIPSNSSAEEIVKAAKKRRIEVHPDRTKRQEGLLAEDLEALDNEAKEVGFAAEILSDELLRKQYDRIYQLWYAFRR